MGDHQHKPHHYGRRLIVKPLVRNAADEGQVREAESRAKRGRELQIEDICGILATRGGRRFMWRYLEECGVFKTSFTGSSQTFFLEGQRNIGLKILADVTEADPDAYLKMMKESKETQNV